MAIAFDNTGEAFAAGVASVESPSWAIAGSDRHLVVGVTSVDSTVLTPTAVKRGGSGGTNLTQNGSPISFNASNQYRGSVWELVAPNAASETIYASWSGSQIQVLIEGCSFTGVNQTTPTRTRSTNTANDEGDPGPALVTASNTVNGDLVVDFLAAGQVTGGANPSLTVGGGQISRAEIDAGDLDLLAGGMSTEAATGSSVAMSWNVDTTVAVHDYAIFALPLIPADTGPGGSGGTRVLPFPTQPMLRGPM
jgi:hypothetical protein